jgi:hypothetical protein
MNVRRLWAYESWIILSFYSLFLYLTIVEMEFGQVKKLVGEKMDGFKRILMVNLILLVFPWGLFLIFAPGDLLEILHLNSIYWRLLGVGSLIGAVIYYFPYRFYKYRLSYYVFIFGTIDNLLAAGVVTALHVMGKAPLIAWGVTPLLMYYSYFFFNQARIFRRLKKSEIVEI